jgi:hypothetical protein
MMNRKTSSQLLETLEQRRLLSASVDLTDGLLTVSGDSNADQIEVRMLADGSVEVATEGNAPTTHKGVQQLAIDAGAGHDSIQLTLDSVPEGSPLIMSIDAGDGNDSLALGAAKGATFADQVMLDLQLGAGNDALAANLDGATFSSMFDLLADGGSGDDQVDVSMNDATLDGAAITSLLLNGGEGADRFEVLMNDPTLLPMDGSEYVPTVPMIRAYISAGAGNDHATMMLGQSEVFFAGIDGGEGYDTAAHSSNVELTSIERDLSVRSPAGQTFGERASELIFS